MKQEASPLMGEVVHSEIMFEDFEDLEIVESIELDQIVDVWDDSITLRLPEGLPIVIKDKELMFLFEHPEAVAEIAPDNHELINSLVPNLLRIRNQKRLLYKELGFCKN